MLNADPALVLSVNVPDVYLALSRLRSTGRRAGRAVMTLHGIQADLLGDAHAFREVLDAVVCTNRLAQGLVEEVSGISSERIHYAAYGVEVDAENAQPKRRSASDLIRIAWVGRLDEEQKRVSDIPRILGALDEMGEAFELQVIGSGPAETRLRDLLTPWITDGRVMMLGALSREVIYSEIYKKVDVFLLTSSWETGPIVIWEAMSMGLPVVTSEYLGSAPEGSLVHGTNCLMYPVGDAAGAARCIAMLRNPEMYQTLSSGGASLVRARYCIEKSISTWNTVLNDIARSGELSASSTCYITEPQGRLDYLLGACAGETVRRYLGIEYMHAEPGGEWPHSLCPMHETEIDMAGLLANTRSFGNKS